MPPWATAATLTVEHDSTLSDPILILHSNRGERPRMSFNWDSTGNEAQKRSDFSVIVIPMIKGIICSSASAIHLLRIEVLGGVLAVDFAIDEHVVQVRINVAVVAEFVQDVERL